jgi:hypothetical protein
MEVQEGIQQVLPWIFAFHIGAIGNDCPPARKQFATLVICGVVSGVAGISQVFGIIDLMVS